MTKVLAFVAAVIFALCFVGTVESASAEEKPTVYKEKVVTGRATVEALDLEKRLVTLKRVDGSVFDITVGPEVRNLPQVKVGDEVVVTYNESILVEVTKPGPTEGSQVKESLTRAKPGERPGGVAAKQVTVTTTVEKIDREKMTATLKGPEGKLVDVDVQNPKNLENVNVGDQVVITYTEALAVSVEPAPKVMVFEEAALFDFDKADLKPEGKDQLKAYREKAQAELSRADKIRIIGYTDNTGAADYNMKLSLQRAEAVRDYLVSIGADLKKMEASGAGEAQPIADNGTKEGQAKNRRVEIELTGRGK